MAAAKTDTTRLEVASREAGSSRATRRLRREGFVPGVLYGRGGDPLPFQVDARELRHALAGAGAVLDLVVDGGQPQPAVLKVSQNHPVRGEITHIDLLRVDLNKPISAVVTIELVGADDAPGVKEGGILEQITREVNIEALPADIPETIQFDVSELQVNDTVTLDALTPPAGVTITDDVEATTLVTLTPPRLQAEAEDEIEAETEVVGEGGEAAEESEADGEGGDGEGGEGE